MTENNYIPGTCNIGPAEIRRRRIVMWLGCILSVVTIASFQQSHASRIDRIVIAPGVLFLFLEFCIIRFIFSIKRIMEFFYVG